MNQSTILFRSCYGDSCYLCCRELEAKHLLSQRPTWGTVHKLFCFIYINILWSNLIFHMYFTCSLHVHTPPHNKQRLDYGDLVINTQKENNSNRIQLNSRKSYYLSYSLHLNTSFDIFLNECPPPPCLSHLVIPV